MPAVTVRHVLHELRISDLGVIDDAVLEPHAGFTVVTGETGAGKTMIVTALGLITGGRGDAARVRAGSDRAVVEARLAIDPAGAPAAITAAAGGRLDEDGTVIAVRSVGADGTIPRAPRRPVRAAGHAVRADRSVDRGARPVRGDLVAAARAAAIRPRSVRRPG